MLQTLQEGGPLENFEPNDSENAKIKLKEKEKEKKKKFESPTTFQL